jgi:hypothetical protein
MKKKIRIGNGMAGMRMPEELLKIVPDRYAVTAFGAEPHGNASAGKASRPELDRTGCVQSFHLFGAA